MNARAVVNPPVNSGRYDYDAAERKQGKRAQRERGCWIYIAAEELSAAGFDPHGPAPYYRAHGHRRSRNAGSVIVSMSASTYTTDPLIFYVPDESTAAQIIERVREIADPRLTIIFEGETGTEVYERVTELNEVLRSFSSFQVPLPDTCPTCGRRT